MALVLLVWSLLVSSCVWPQFRFGASRSAFNLFQSGLGPRNVANLEVVWTASSGSAFASYEGYEGGRPPAAPRPPGA